MKKVRLADIAKDAQVGTATVERVLNERGSVSPATVEKVIEAARRLGYRQPIPDRYRGVLRIEVMMVRRETPFFHRLANAFQRISESLDPCLQVHRTFAEESDPANLARRIANPGFRRRGLIIVAPDHPDVRVSLKAAREAGQIVVQIVSRIGDEADFFVGIDNYAAGRMAGLLMTRLLGERRGRIVALCHSGTYEVHRERIKGFSDYLIGGSSERHALSHVLFGLDQDLRSAEMIAEALSDDPGIIGIYNAGGANEGVASVLERTDVGRTTVWIGHELTDGSRQWLRSGLMDVVLDQAPEAQAQRSMDALLHKIGFIKAEIATEPIRFYTITSENL